MGIYIPDPEYLGRRRFPDYRGFRRNLRIEASDVLSQLQSLLPSNYPKVPDTNLAAYYRIMSREFARLNYSMGAINNDKQYTQTRIELLYQILGERLFLSENIAPLNYNDQTYRDYLTSIKSAYLKGSKVSDIEYYASSFLGLAVNIKELYKISPFLTDTNKMTVEVFIDDTPTDIVLLQQGLDFFINLVKPAHVLYDTRLIWTEEFVINKIYDILFGDLGGGCVPVYDFTEFSQPTILAQQVFVQTISEGALGKIGSIHYDDNIFYLDNGTRVIVEPGINGTKIYNAAGKQISIQQLQIDQYVRVTYQTIPGEFQFWWYPSDILPLWQSQFYKDVYRLPVFQENVKKIMDNQGRFPLQIRTTATTICDRWVQDLLDPVYEDLRHVCADGATHEYVYEYILTDRRGFPKYSIPYSEAYDDIVLGSDFIYLMGNTPLTDGSSSPATILDVSVWYDGTGLADTLTSIDASSGRLDLRTDTTYWTTSISENYPITGQDFTFGYNYLKDGTNDSTAETFVYGISHWQLPKSPVVKDDSSGSLADINDIKVSVDGTLISNAVINLVPILGHVTLNAHTDFWLNSELGRKPRPTLHLGDGTYQTGDIFSFDYFYGEKYSYAILFDDISRTFDTYGDPYSFLFDGGDSTGATTDAGDPLLIGYRYRAIQLHHSSVLNSPDTLLLNKYQKPAKRASIANQQETISNFNIFFSPEFLYDTSSPQALTDAYLDNGLDPVLKLYSGTPPFQKTFAYQPGLIYQRKLQDIRRHHHPLMYSALLLKEFPEGDESVPLSPICESSSIHFKLRMGEDTLNPLQECSPWELFDTVVTEEELVTIPGLYRGIPNLRVPTELLRNNFILRELESTGEAQYTYTAYTPSNQEPPTVIYLPETFDYSYNDETIRFPALPILGGFEVSIDGTSWNVISLNPTTGRVELDAYPLASYSDSHTVTQEDLDSGGFWIPGYPVGVFILSIQSGPVFTYPHDFHFEGRFLSWRGSPKESLISVGDIMDVAGTINEYVNAEMVFSYRISNTFITEVIDRDRSRVFDDIYVFPYLCDDGQGWNITWHFNEYINFLSDYSHGIKIKFYNKDTHQVEDHVFSGPVFELFNQSDDELGSPENFPNALVRLSPVSHPNNPMAGAYDFDFINDLVVRFRKKQIKELLPDRTFKTTNIVEMLPV